MDGLLIFESRSGRVLYSRPYTEGFGLRTKENLQQKNMHREEKEEQKEQESEKNADEGAASSTPTALPLPPADPQIAAMLLANFLSAFYTHTCNQRDEGVITAAAFEETIRHPFQSYESPSSTGTNDDQQQQQQSSSSLPLLFFHASPTSNLLCALFLRRTILASHLHSTNNSLHACGDWLVQKMLSTFVSTFKTELDAVAEATKSPRSPTIPANGTKVYRTFQVISEEIYRSEFSLKVLEAILKHTEKVCKPKWMYVVNSSVLSQTFDETSSSSLQSNTAVAPVAARIYPTPASQPPPAANKSSSMKVGDLSDVIVPSASAAPPSFQVASFATVLPPITALPLIPAVTVASSSPQFSPSPTSLLYDSSPSPSPLPTVPRFQPTPPTQPRIAPVASATTAAASRPLIPLSAATQCTTSIIPRPRYLHPFTEPLHKWWQFSAKQRVRDEMEEQDVWYGRIEQSVVMYQFEKGRVGDGRSETVKENEEMKSETDQPPPTPEFDNSLCLPTPDAFKKLMLLVRSAARIMAAMGGDEKMQSMEITVKEKIAWKGEEENEKQKLCVVRIGEVLLCIPTTTTATAAATSTATASSTQSPSSLCTYSSLLSTLKPYFSCLEMHYLYVKEMNERAIRVAQKKELKRKGGK